MRHQEAVRRLGAEVEHGLKQPDGCDLRYRRDARQLPLVEQATCMASKDEERRTSRPLWSKTWDGGPGAATGRSRKYAPAAAASREGRCLAGVADTGLTTSPLARLRLSAEPCSLLMTGTGRKTGWNGLKFSIRSEFY